ncbi:FAD/NAD(P)-binding domain containing protein [Parasponia andersonii]|uniref:FAD/NAD(P)-binding domain containing protein n=1 Tax=Parasponia andersonii TaxID=3476 RepID=A0A2P5AEU0_PARAD|nr:FAD/NAD(P)-binding domain containing protein [Parasponia andersonii]
MTVTVLPTSTSPFFLAPASPKPTPVRIRFKPRASSSSSSSVHPRVNSSQPSSNPYTGVIVVGAGLAGLAAATRLSSENVPFLLLEASNEVGGRVRTDFADGFTLDRGFQIFITAYPEAKKLLDYEALDLQRFYSGARVYYGGEFHTVADPIRHLGDSLQSLANPIGSILDKLLIASTRIRVLTKPEEEILTAREVSTIELLRATGFSDSIIGRFFRPLFGGIFFDRDLETSSRLFDFIFKCLALGDNTVPAKGIGEIPKQLAKKLPSGSIRYGSRAVAIDSDGFDSPAVRLQTGEVLRSELGVIVAVDQPESDKLLRPYGLNPAQRKAGRSTVCLYFSADRAEIPALDPVLFLNGSGEGIVNNMFFATNVAPSYGPPDKALVSVSLIGSFDGVSDDDLTAEVVRELSVWFKGSSSTVGNWKHLRTYRIGFAQPNQSPPTNLLKDPKVGPGLYLCGDHLTSATFDGALVSGRRAAETLLRDRAVVRV